MEIFINNGMNYLTQYYKNICEQLQEKLNILEMQLNEAGLKKALTTNDPSLLRKEILKGEARRKRAQQEMEETDISGAMETYGASSEEAARALGRQNLLQRKIEKLDINLDTLENANRKIHTTGSQQY